MDAPEVNGRRSHSQMTKEQIEVFRDQECAGMHPADDFEGPRLLTLNAICDLALKGLCGPKDDGKAVRLWKLLDDIDTLSDACKGDDWLFRETCYRIQRRRFEIMSGEEYDAAKSGATDR